MKRHRHENHEVAREDAARYLRRPVRASVEARESVSGLPRDSEAAMLALFDSMMDAVEPGEYVERVVRVCRSGR